MQQPPVEPIRMVTLYLMDAQSYRYDAAYYPSFGLRSRALPMRRILEPSLEQLLEDGNAGEGPEIEHKAWIPPTGEKEKWRELLNVVVSFADTEEEGRWSIVAEGPPSVELLRAARACLALSLAEVAALKARLPGILATGTRSEMEVLRNRLHRDAGPEIPIELAMVESDVA